MPEVKAQVKKRRGRPPKVKKEKPVAEAPAVEVGTLRQPQSKKEEAKFAFEGRYIYAVGRRKESTAEVKLYPEGESGILINNKSLASYFPVFELQKTVLDPLKVTGNEGKVGVSVIVNGGGIRGQAEATRLGIARALVLMDSNLRPQLKARGFLKRDARVKERRKYGLKKARKAPQWAKR
ncbi:MAG: 30S ribosomal protein S9 [Parcubacteria group bacterium]|nr:30S ribosomal protein S9 [Parcubacteria group bacterium]